MYSSKEETVSTSLHFWEICIIPGKNFEYTGWNVEEMLIPKQTIFFFFYYFFFFNGNIFWVSPGTSWTRDLREKARSLYLLVVLYLIPLKNSGQGLSTSSPAEVLGQQVPIWSVVALQYGPGVTKTTQKGKKEQFRKHKSHTLCITKQTESQHFESFSRALHQVTFPTIKAQERERGTL